MSSANCHLGIGQCTDPEVFHFRLVSFGSESLNPNKSVVINMADINRHTKNFRYVVLGDRHSASVCFCIVSTLDLNELSLPFLIIK